MRTLIVKRTQSDMINVKQRFKKRDETSERTEILFKHNIYYGDLI